MLRRRVAQTLRRFAALFYRTRADRELNLEIADHLACETEKNVARGMPVDDAARQARLAFGPVEAMKEAHRDGRGVPWLDAFVADVRYAFRQLVRAPVFACVSVFVLAIGIGVNSAVVAFVDGILRPRALGLTDASELVRVTVWSRYGISGTWAQMYDEFRDLRERQQVFSNIGAYTSRAVIAGVGETREREYAAFASGDYFATVRPRMFVGRSLPSAPDRGAAPDLSVVISHTYWRAQFGGDTAVVGRSLFVNGVPLRVAGVLPARITGLGNSLYRPGPDLTIPLSAFPVLFANDSAFMHAPTQHASFAITARLKPGVSVADANRAIKSISPLCRESSRGRRCVSDDQVRPLMEFDADAGQILAVGGATSILTGLILAIACANISILLLGRAVTRRREIAIRLSLGAARWRVLKQLLTESVVLAILSSGVGLLILRWINGLIRANFSELGTDLSPSWRTVAISIGFAAGTGVLFGLVPALHATRASVAASLKDASGSADRARTRLQRSFVVAEVALSVMLVCVTGLFAEVARRELMRDAGYTISDNVLVSGLALYASGRSPTSIDAAVTAARDRVAALPGVEFVGISSGHPMTTEMAGNGFVETSDSGGRRPPVRTRIALADDGYFEAAGISVPVGATFAPNVGPGTAPVAIINATLARALWPDANPVGRTITFARQDRTRPWSRVDALFEARSATVIGVTAFVERGSVGTERHLVYLHRRQIPLVGDLSMVVRTNSAPTTIVPLITSALRAADPTLPFGPLRSTRHMAGERTSDMEQAGKGAALAAAFALALACVGLFAIVAFGVAQRSREIGIRIALGATQQQVVSRFFADGMRLALIGFAIGVPLALGVIAVFRAQIVGVGSFPAASVSAIIGILLIVAALASWLPASRAARVDPVNSLRSE